jgi:hypothetical protein
MPIILENEKGEKRFTLILARTGKELNEARETTPKLHRLAGEDRKSRRKLIGRSYTRRDSFPGDCSYSGIFQPGKQIERRIGKTEACLNDAKN